MDIKREFGRKLVNDKVFPDSVSDIPEDTELPFITYCGITRARTFIPAEGLLRTLPMREVQLWDFYATLP